MKTRLLSNDDGVRTHIVVLDSGEEAFETLTRFANEAGIAGASLSAIGAFDAATERSDLGIALIDIDATPS